MYRVTLILSLWAQGWFLMFSSLSSCNARHDFIGTDNLPVLLKVSYGHEILVR